jgi:hypothetical protein
MAIYGLNVIMSYAPEGENKNVIIIIIIIIAIIM